MTYTVRCMIDLRIFVTYCMHLFQRILDTGARHRSNAFGERDSPNTARLRRHSSSRDIRIRGQIMVEVPRTILRGSGFSAYHVYEVKVSVFENRAQLCRTKAHCVMLHICNRNGGTSRCGRVLFNHAELQDCNI